jgi:predicted RNA-binding protein YlqC (UPF0109 family)
MKELIEDIVKLIVDDPDSVEITEVGSNNTHILELAVAKEDIGKVIGRRGAHANALRTLIAAMGGKYNKRYVLEIVE